MKVEKTNLQTRNYGIDMLRIVCMFFVCLLHVLGKGGILQACTNFPLKHAVVWMLEIAAYCAINSYALISGFVGYKAKFKYSNIIYLYFQVVFYVLGITTLFAVFVPGSVSGTDFVKAVFPFAFDTYWYFTAYFGLFFFIPVLNIFIDKVCGRVAVYFLGIVVVLFCVFPIVFQKDIYFLHDGYSVMWLAALYVIGGFIRKYELAFKISQKTSFMGYIASTITIWLSVMGIEILTTAIWGSAKGSMLFISYTSPFVLFQAIMLVLFAAKWKLSAPTTKFVKFFAPVAFGVYLIHEEPFMTNAFIMDKFVKYADNSCVTMVVATMATAICIWFICSIIDRGRLVLFELMNIRGGYLFGKKNARIRRKNI